MRQDCHYVGKDDYGNHRVGYESVFNVRGLTKQNSTDGKYSNLDFSVLINNSGIGLVGTRLCPPS